MYKRQQYNTLKEKGFYSNILGTSSVFSIYCESVAFNKGKMEFTYYGRQRIERRSNILMRELVTPGQLKRVPRTENNPHGLLIVNWRTLLNPSLIHISAMCLMYKERVLHSEETPLKIYYTDRQGCLLYTSRCV